MEKSSIITRTEGRAGYITLNRPKVMNAINLEMMQELEEAARSLSLREDISAVVVKGAGRGFCAGADLKFLLSVIDRPKELEAFIVQINRAFNSLEDLMVPVVAIVQDYALAGGFELLQVCDIVVAAEEARLGDQHTGFWMIPGAGGTQRLPYIVGQHRAKDLLFTGRWLSGREAAQIGIVSKAVPLEDLERAETELVENLSQKSPITLREMKELIQYPFKEAIRKALKHELEVFMRYIQTPSALEGLRAFSQRRKPDLDAIAT